MLHIISSIVVGFFIGLLSRALMPGPDSMGFLMTVALGIGGSFVGGLIGRLINRPGEGSAFHPAGLFMSIVGALVLLYLGRVAWSP